MRKGRAWEDAFQIAVALRAYKQDDGYQLSWLQHQDGLTRHARWVLKLVAQMPEDALEDGVATTAYLYREGPGGGVQTIQLGAFVDTWLSLLARFKEEYLKRKLIDGVDLDVDDEREPTNREIRIQMMMTGAEKAS